MTTKPFAINYNLDKLSEAERAQYLIDLSVFVGLDPNLNAFETLWMPDGYGRRNLVAYARRGTAEMLRAMHGINVLLCEDRSTATQAVFIVYGKDKTGRQEVSVGAAPLVGLAGERLSSAIMSANTRANRRLTLQFVGCGILDESEVQDSTANAASEAKPIGAPIVFPAPSVAPNAAPGKDVTPQPPAAPKEETTYTPTETQEQFEARQAGLRATAAGNLQALATGGLKDAPPAEAPAAPVRKRRARNTKDLNADATQPAEAQVSTPTVTAPVPQPTATVVEAAPALVQESVAATLSVPNPALAEFDVYRKRLAEIAKTLLNGGVRPLPGIGGVNAQIKKFAMLQLGSEVIETYTLAQWKELFDTLDVFADDTPGLIAYITKAITA